jgi:VWFA-related protein
VTAPALCLAALVTTQSPPPVFGAQTEVVRVEVRVSRGDEPVLGLTAEDFDVQDNGVPQRVNPVVLARVPLDVLLVLDLSASVRGKKLLALREAAASFLDGLEEGDMAGLLSFASGFGLGQPPTPRLSEVRRRLLAADSLNSSTALHDAVFAALRVQEVSERLRALVVFSDGVDTASWLSAGEVVDAARRSSPIVYAVQMRDPADPPKDEFLDRVATATGGRVWGAQSGEDLRGRFLEVLRDIRTRYLLSYTPRGAERGGWHQIRVRLRNKAGDVLARPGYFRPLPEAK